MTLYIVNSLHPGTLCQSEIVYEYGIAHAHAIKGVSAQRRHFNARCGRVNSKGGVQHGKSPAVAYCVYRQQSAQLEALRPFSYEKRAGISNTELTDLYKDCTDYTWKSQI